MKTITEYQCEICSKKYDTMESALQCESKGVVNSNTLPVGLIFEYHHSGGFVGIFSIATSEHINGSHSLYTSWWACRGGDYGQVGDSLGENTCSTGSYVDIEFFMKRFITNEHVGGPEFNRMVDFLKSNGITPTYFNENKEIISVS